METRIMDGIKGMSDRLLLEKYVARRNSNAFAVFMDRHEAAVLSFASSFLRDDLPAQDVVQEVFLRVAQNPQRVPTDHDTAARNWLLRIAHNLCVDEIRRRSTTRKISVGLRETLSQTVPAAETQLEAEEKRAQVLAAVNRLPERQRELVLLKISEKKSYKEIAAITGLTVTNVGFQLHQAMKTLAGELKEVVS
jgi:RNA polymerase sigma-70 factor (ECF subfamily)